MFICRRYCDPFYVVKYLRFRAVAVLLGVLSLTSLALVFHKTFVFNSAYKIRRLDEIQAGDTVAETKNDENTNAACKLPVLDPYHSSVVQFIKDLGKLQCKGVSFSSFDSNVLRIEGEGIVSTQYRKIERPPGKDFGVVLSAPAKVQNTDNRKGKMFR